MFFVYILDVLPRDKNIQGQLVEECVNYDVVASKLYFRKQYKYLLNDHNCSKILFEIMY